MRNRVSILIQRTDDQFLLMPQQWVEDYRQATHFGTYLEALLVAKQISNRQVRLVINYPNGACIRWPVPGQFSLAKTESVAQGTV